jgi:hypothetical protein
MAEDGKGGKIVAEDGKEDLHGRSVLAALLSLIVRAGRGELIRKPKYRANEV